jgi:hypothetical protein
MAIMPASSVTPTLMPETVLPCSGSQNVFVEAARTGATTSAHGPVGYRSQLLSGVAKLEHVSVLRLESVR